MCHVTTICSMLLGILPSWPLFAVMQLLMPLLSVILRRERTSVFFFFFVSAALSHARPPHPLSSFLLFCPPRLSRMALLTDRLLQDRVPPDFRAAAAVPSLPAVGGGGDGGSVVVWREWQQRGRAALPVLLLFGVCSAAGALVLTACLHTFFVLVLDDSVLCVCVCVCVFSSLASPALTG